MKKFFALLVTLVGWAMAAACSPGDSELVEPWGSVEQGVRCVNGAGDTCHPTCLCAAGWGDCDGNSDCQAGLVCGADNGAKFGFAALLDVCVPGHCVNSVADAALGETGFDCGGACGECPGGPTCPSNGLGNTCSAQCPCAAGWGDCDSSTECQSGLECVNDIGARFGLKPLLDVCTPSHCNNRVQDSALGETGIDEGGPCGACPGNGLANTCSAQCPCQSGWGDCDGNEDCQPGLVCPGTRNGEKFGIPPLFHTCVPAHCTNGVLDAGAGETDPDCGGPCGVCPDGCIPPVPAPEAAGTGPFAFESFLSASTPGQTDYFGWSVAIDGDTMVVGAPFESSAATGVNGDQSNDAAFQSGAAYVFVRSGGEWLHQAYLKASNTDPQDFFGKQVAISGDTIVVGAPGEASAATGVNGDQSDNTVGSTGAVYVFVRSGTTWSQQAYIKGAHPHFDFDFGEVLEISEDTLVVGLEDSTFPIGGGVSNGGRAYVFVRSGGSWSQQAYLQASNADENDDGFGISATISGDTLVVGAPREGSAATGVDGNQASNAAPLSGAAYVFVRCGAEWFQQAYLKASNTEPHDFFGVSIAISRDTIVVGAGREDSAATGINGDQTSNASTDSGAAYVFIRSGTTWSQQAYLKASNSGAGDSFGKGVYGGEGVAIAGDTVVIGAFSEDSNTTGTDGDQTNDLLQDAGAAYVFVRSGTTWSQQSYLKASTNTHVGGGLGSSVAVSRDTVVAGAYQGWAPAQGGGPDVQHAGTAHTYTR